MSNKSSDADMLRSRINSVYEEICWGISSFFKYDLPSFIVGNRSHIVAVLCSAAGLFAWSKDVLWVLIVGGVIGFFARMHGFYMAKLLGKDSVPLLQSSITLLILSLLGSLHLHFVDKIGVIASFFLSLNITMLLLYVLIIVLVQLIRLYGKVLCNISLWNFERDEKKKAVNIALEQAGLTRKQVKYVRVKRAYDSQKDKFYYEVYFYFRDRRLGYKVWC